MAQKPLIQTKQLLQEREQIAALSVEQIEERLQQDVQQYVAFSELIAKYLTNIAQLQERMKLYVETLQAKGVVIEGLEALQQQQQQPPPENQDNG